MYIIIFINFVTGGPYEPLSGRDASRALATFSMETSKEYDDLSDLQTAEMESILEWQEQFKGTCSFNYIWRLSLLLIYCINIFIKKMYVALHYSDIIMGEMELDIRTLKSKR